MDLFSLQNTQTIDSEFCGEGELEIRTKRSRKWFRCLCPDYMEGRNCEHQLNYCRLYYGQYQKRCVTSNFECEFKTFFSPCEHYCENDTRSFYCACHDGFMLGENGYNCEGIVNLCLTRFRFTSGLVDNPVIVSDRPTFIKNCLARKAIHFIAFHAASFTQRPLATVSVRPKVSATHSLQTNAPSSSSQNFHSYYCKYTVSYQYKKITSSSKNIFQLKKLDFKKR